MRILAFAPAANSDGKKDASGAFQPEMFAGQREWNRSGHSTRPILFDNRQPRLMVAEKVLGQIAAEGKAEPIGLLAIFAHGLRDRLPQLGIGLHGPPKAPVSVASLVAVLKGALTSDAKIVLYACDTGRDLDLSASDDTAPDAPGGEGGFADALADGLRATGWTGWVDAHVTAAHTTWNPYVRRFRGDSRGGIWIVEPRSEAWGRWVKGVRGGSLRFRFPLMHEDAIHAELDQSILP